MARDTSHVHITATGRRGPSFRVVEMAYLSACPQGSARKVDVHTSLEVWRVQKTKRPSQLLLTIHNQSIWLPPQRLSHTTEPAPYFKKLWTVSARGGRRPTREGLREASTMPRRSERRLIVIRLSRSASRVTRRPPWRQGPHRSLDTSKRRRRRAA